MTPNRYEGYKVCLRLKRNHLKISFQCLKMRFKHLKMLSRIFIPISRWTQNGAQEQWLEAKYKVWGSLGCFKRFLDNLDLRCAQLLAHLVALLVPQWLCQLGPQLVPQLLALLLAQLVAPQVWGPKGRDECVKIKL